VNAHHAQTGQVDLYDDTTTDNLLKLEQHTGFRSWADELWKLATAMGIRRQFFQGEATSTFCLSFPRCWIYSAKWRSQNASSLRPCCTQRFL